MKKLVITKRTPDEYGEQTRTVRVSKRALAIVNELCRSTNRTQQDITSRLIEFAFEHCEVNEEE